MIVAVTGAAGFVGQEACRALIEAGHAVHALATRPFALGEGAAAMRVTLIGDLAQADSLEDHLAGADAVIHLAARAHHLKEKPEEAAGAYPRDVQVTRALAMAAARAGVRRLVFLSSVKALGDRSPGGALSRAAVPKPVDPYGRGKLAAERELAGISASARLQVAVIRAPLVYGARAGANFRQMVRWVRRGVPLPLGAVRNRRSIVSVENLASAIVRSLTAPSTAFDLLHVADPTAVSTPELLRLVAEGLEVPSRLFSVPPALLESVCRVTGRKDIAARLLESLELETEDSFAALGWRPAMRTSEGIVRAVRGMQL